MIAEYCRKHNVAVTSKEIDEEIDPMAKQFKLPKDQWLKLLEKERGIRREQYAQDIVWPTLALRKLAAAQLTVTREGKGQGLREPVWTGSESPPDRRATPKPMPRRCGPRPWPIPRSFRPWPASTRKIRPAPVRAE